MRPALWLLLALVAPLAAAQGTFTRIPISLPQDVIYESVAPADMDADGDLDLLVIRTDSVNGGGGLVYPELYRNEGVGADSGLAFARAPFPAAPYASTSPSGAAVSWADVDGDGDVDALVATHAGTTLYHNDGTGQFADADASLPTYVERTTFYFAEPRSAAWADVDNDGDLDLALPEYILAYPDTTRLVLYANDSGSLARTDAAFPTLDGDLGLTWGDVDGDGDTDLLYLSAGEPCDDSNVDAVECLILYDNDGGTLTPVPLDVPEIEAGAADLGDFDLDGDLDILLVAELSNEPFDHYDRAIVYRNDGGGAFAADTLAFPFDFDAVFDDLLAGQWADYDSDGDVDILLGGNLGFDGGAGDESGGQVFVFANDGGVGGGPAAFSLAATLPASNLYGTLTWADFDGDGDLDLLSTGDRLENTGGNQWGYVYVARLFRNDTPASNAPPSSPAGLSATATADGAALVWAPATDDHTPAASLTYNLRVSTHDGQDVVSPHARTGGGRLVPEPGNVSLNRQWTLRSLAPGEYTWAVQAVDNAFNGGPFADGGSFTVGAVGTGAGANDALAVLMLAPNPTVGPAEAALTLPHAAHATVVVFDALGRRVATLANATLAAGRHAWPLGTMRLAPGIYTVRAVVGAAPALVGRLTVVR